MKGWPASLMRTGSRANSSPATKAAGGLRVRWSASRYIASAGIHSVATNIAL